MNTNNSMTLNSTPIVMKVNEKRPHFYHVICYDLMLETMTQNAENSKKVNQAQRALFCLVCQQEKIAKDEIAREEEDERQRKQLMEKSEEMRRRAQRDMGLFKSAVAVE